MNVQCVMFVCLCKYQIILIFLSLIISSKGLILFQQALAGTVEQGVHAPPNIFRIIN